MNKKSKDASNEAVRKASRKINKKYRSTFQSLASTKLWKKYGEVRLNPDQTIDEIVINNCDFHLEQMDNGSWWIGIYTGPRTGVKPKYGKRKNRKDTMRIMIFNPNNKVVTVNCETDDNLINIIS